MAQASLSGPTGGGGGGDTEADVTQSLVTYVQPLFLLFSWILTWAEPEFDQQVVG